MTSTIAVDDLRVGMYIHLDGGWLSHPFPLSAFRISSQDEILTLHRLGLKQVRWVPEKSELAANEVPTAGAAAAATAVVVALPTAEDLEQQRHQAWLAAQRAAAKLCERQYAEAALAWRGAWDNTTAQPQQAGRTTEALARAMLDKMLAADEVGIRLISGGGDRVAAHALNVAVISLLIGRTLGMDEADMMNMGVGALMHDVGKQELPDRLRHADDAFNNSEHAIYREHVGKGLALGKRMALAEGALDVISQHHEHADGTGFPKRIVGERMPLASRIVAIVNRYDNLCNPATRALAMTPHEAVAMLFAQGRTRFDATVLNAFIRMMGVYPAGSLVQLTDDRYALVVGVNSTRPLKPRVLVHSPPRGRGAADTQLVDLEGQPDLGIRRSLPPAKLPPAVLAALDPRPRVTYYFEPLARENADAELAA
jgi:putative nucleotidyltransferase with HDIG domain